MMLYIAFPRALTDDTWNQLRLRLLQEEPFEIGFGNPFFFRLVLPSGHESFAALPGTVAAFVEPAALIRDEANTAIAIRICAFHDTFQVHLLTPAIPSVTHLVSQ